jgi:hypothetical protein
MLLHSLSSLWGVDSYCLLTALLVALHGFDIVCNWGKAWNVVLLTWSKPTDIEQQT